MCSLLSNINNIFRQLKAVGDVQDALNSYDVVTSVLDHLSRPQDEVVKEVLGFMSALLFNGNENVQVNGGYFLCMQLCLHFY